MKDTETEALVQDDCDEMDPLTNRRAFILTVGPLAIVAICYWLTMAGGDVKASRAHVVRTTAGVLEQGRVLPETAALAFACERTAAALAQRLNADCQIIVRPPFVLGGDISAEDLERQYRRTIVPTSAALTNTYFDRTPTEPITILLFSDGRSYRDFSRELDGHRQDTYFGYYQKSARRIVLNNATGNGTLAHELTHALADFDFPNMPEWFDEGLASLHEQSEFSKDGLRLLGVSNWRKYHLIYAIRTNRLRSLESLIAGGAIREGHEAIDYAHARYFCLFLQSKNLLSRFYRAFRTNVTDDPTGIQTLCHLMQTDSLSEIDSAFREWFIEELKRGRS